MHAIEFFALDNHHQARTPLVFVGIEEVTRSFEDGKRADHGEGEIAEAATELFEVKFERMLLAFALRNLEVVGHIVVDFANFLLRRKGLCDALGEESHISRMGQEDGLGRCAVASGSSGFLEIGFQGIGRIEVYHESHIGFVDAHAEALVATITRVRSFCHASWRAFLSSVGQSRMVVERGDACAL